MCCFPFVNYITNLNLYRNKNGEFSINIVRLVPRSDYLTALAVH
jgi:hypothetical protein